MESAKITCGPQAARRKGIGKRLTLSCQGEEGDCSTGSIQTKGLELQRGMRMKAPDITFKEDKPKKKKVSHTAL